MAKRASAGELRTRIYIRRVVKKPDKEGVPIHQEESVLRPMPDGRERVWRCKWVNAYGGEVFTAMQAQVQEPATLTMRYCRQLQVDQLIYREKDPAPYEIISINDVEERHAWMEVKVQRRRAAR